MSAQQKAAKIAEDEANPAEVDITVWLRAFEGPGSLGTNEAADEIERLRAELSKKTQQVVNLGWRIGNATVAIQGGERPTVVLDMLQGRTKYDGNEIVSAL